MKFFSVDRRDAYVEWKRIELARNLEPSDNEIVRHIHTMYPGGFSNHGATYFRDAWDNPAPEDYNSGVLELLLEATRKAHYPAKPCRYQSMFACDSVEAALQFRSQHGKATDPVYELHPQAEVHRGDMGVYAFGKTFAGIDHRLHLYWQGKSLDIPDHQPRWEYVLPLPVLVGQKLMV